MGLIDTVAPFKSVLAQVLCMEKYGGREVQTKITTYETLLQSLRQIYILENIFTYKTKWHYHNTFTSPETNLHFRKQINKTQNTR